MSLLLSDIGDLRQKIRNPIHVGNVPYSIAKKLYLKNSNVYLSLASYLHIQKVHPDITDFDMLLLPFIIDRGLLATEDAKPNIIMCSYLDPNIGKRFIASLKVTADATEIWVSSMYRARKRQTKAILARATMIKAHS
jgi:hypothetical protein